MKKLYILLVFCIAMMAIGDGYAQRSKHKHRGKHKTHKVAKKKKQKRSKKKVAKFTPLPEAELLPVEPPYAREAAAVLTSLSEMIQPVPWPQSTSP